MVNFEDSTSSSESHSSSGNVFENVLQRGSFRVVERIGCGGSGVVDIVEIQHCKAALKTVQCHTIAEVEEYAREITVLSTLSGHKNVINILDSHIEEGGNTISSYS